MFRSLKTAIRFFALGMAAGILIAPRPGSETRQLLKDKFNQFRTDAGELMAVAWPVFDDIRIEIENFAGDADESTATPLKARRPRAAAGENNGRGRSRRKTETKPIAVG